MIAAITSCTNTSNPSVMVAAGLLAKKAVERGLQTKPWVKASLAPGSKVVTDYLEDAGLQTYLDQLRFNLVGYGCTTCIGNSGPLSPEVTEAIHKDDLVAAAVLSGNRNFEGRINPEVRANYLASPPLVVAYALAGTMDFDMQREPLGNDQKGRPVFLEGHLAQPARNPGHDLQIGSIRDVPEQVRRSLRGRRELELAADARGRSLRVGQVVHLREEPALFPGHDGQARPGRADRKRAGAGAAGRQHHDRPHLTGGLDQEGQSGGTILDRARREPGRFQLLRSRRGNDEVMVRGTFANIRLNNRLAPGTEGGWTRHLPDGETMTIFDASVRYQAEGVPLIVLAGKEYGSGSSRDWAAKGPRLLGIRAVIAESYERIHRSNLVGMGILPLQFKPGETAEELGLTGEELYSIAGLDRTDRRVVFAPAASLW